MRKQHELLWHKVAAFWAWFKRRLQFMAAGVDARGVSVSPFAPRKSVLSSSERRHWKALFRGAKGDTDMLPAKRVT